MAVERYNAGIQRAKGLLEIAAALYDTSLSYKTAALRRRAANRFPRRPGLASFTRGKQECAGKPCADLFYYREFSGNYRRRPGRLLSSLGKPLGAVNDGLSRQKDRSRSGCRCARSRSFRLSMSWALRCTSRPASCRSLKSSKSANSAGFHRHSAAQRHRGQRDDVYCFGGAPCRRIYTRRHAQMGRPIHSVPRPAIPREGGDREPLHRCDLRRRDQELGSNCFGQRLSLFAHRGKGVETNDRARSSGVPTCPRCSFHGTKIEVQPSTSVAGR